MPPRRMKVYWIGQQQQQHQFSFSPNSKFFDGKKEKTFRLFCAKKNSRHDVSKNNILENKISGKGKKGK